MSDFDVNNRCKFSIEQNFEPKTRVYSQIYNLTIPNGTLNTISSKAFLLNGSSFSGENRGIQKERVMTYLMAQSLPLKLKTIFFICTSIVYGAHY